MSKLPSTNSEEEQFEVNINDAYEDDDFTIYFDKNTLLNHINHLEDDNLFKINLLQQEEINLEKLLKQKETSVVHIDKQIEDVNKNIVGFKSTRE